MSRSTRYRRQFLRCSTEGADGLMQSYMKMFRSSSLIEYYRNYLQMLFLWTLARGFHWMSGGYECVRKRNGSIFYVKCQNQDTVGRRRQDTYDVVGYLKRRSLLLFRLSQCVVRLKYNLHFWWTFEECSIWFFLIGFGNTNYCWTYCSFTLVSFIGFSPWLYDENGDDIWRTQS